jgi:hypothetical protein
MLSMLSCDAVIHYLEQHSIASVTSGLIRLYQWFGKPSRVHERASDIALEKKKASHAASMCGRQGQRLDRHTVRAEHIFDANTVFLHDLGHAYLLGVIGLDAVEVGQRQHMHV